ncbi:MULTISPECIES: hypothetical protein [unclassified Mesorhizobium]|uniref:hypothetical protein n=1 Tax=unclassified Mesorhizobium TaxID=325217 RepID=UPI000FCA7F01|nr:MULTISPECIES: hypothetical protein [unclassified Mesorhizobium]RUW01104.1 hypothetical protein EOA49_12365 [Mesorhizobium sp. M1A.F.Ca.IN.020.04.1.1]RUW09395.1 hypothetical protein EOA53_16725 [Mesorhizobium sp. M1A.F.Ca.IN.020.03.1.1]RWF75494.1 MAG: hypothetical protein EOQ34_01655 [Mesorhizobium sp.]RWG16722.1 MAG: hypothetical protein EOQ58_07325 [Mesorhizobium sp.]RWG33439.1 MAG: hypothetical protein EOQ61_08345 [Mesorhizobium sp.]
MTTADWALVISLMSACISAAGFVWNVWSKFIYPKAKVRTSFSVMTVISKAGESPPFLNLSATNYGPGAVTLYAAVVRPKEEQGTLPYFLRTLFKVGSEYGLLNPLANFPLQLDFTEGPFSGGLPKNIEVGESFSVRLGFKHQSLRDDNIVDVGFEDTFGRRHWAPRRQVRTVIARIRRDFPRQANPLTRDGAADREANAEGEARGDVGEQLQSEGAVAVAQAMLRRFQ